MTSPDFSRGFDSLSNLIPEDRREGAGKASLLAIELSSFYQARATLSTPEGFIDIPQGPDFLPTVLSLLAFLPPESVSFTSPESVTIYKRDIGPAQSARASFVWNGSEKKGAPSNE